MTVTTIPTETAADEQLDVLVRRFTPKQRAKLDRLERAPWKWFVSDARFFQLVDEYDREAQERTAQALLDERRAYWELMSRVTTYQGEDYRIFNGSSWIRATKLQFDQADALGVRRSVGVPAEIA